MRPLQRLCAMLAFLLADACSSGPPESGVPEDAAEARQWRRSFFTGAPWPTVWLLVIDDAPTPEAEVVRGGALDWFFDGPEGCGRRNDPAYVVPADVRVVLVPASRPQGGVTSVSRPEWGLGPHRADSGAVEDAQRAVRDAVGELMTERVEPLRALEGLEHWRALLVGERAAETEEEAFFLLDLPARYSLTVLVAASRDEESRIAGVGEMASGQIWWSSALYYGSAACEPFGGAGLEREYPRLSEGAPWSSVVCSGAAWSPVPLTCGVSCPSAPARLEGNEGQVSCRVWLTLGEGESCRASRGWLDPPNAAGRRVPTVVEEEGRVLRLCEVRQLEGEALESCRADPGCAGCGAGWCLREPWTDEQIEAWGLEREEWACPDRDTVDFSRFRFTGGADWTSGKLEVVCDH